MGDGAAHSTEILGGAQTDGKWAINEGTDERTVSFLTSLNVVALCGPITKGVRTIREGIANDGATDS